MTHVRIRTSDIEQTKEQFQQYGLTIENLCRSAKLMPFVREGVEPIPVLLDYEFDTSADAKTVSDCLQHYGILRVEQPPST